MSGHTGFQLAELNIAEMKAPLESPLMSEFADNIERINALAEQAPGFVWRLQTDDGDATALRPFGENTLVNLSVWESIAALSGYVYRSEHAQFLKRRREWFNGMGRAHLVLWWVPHGHRPDLQEAAARLEHLKAHGPTAQAFRFRDDFPPMPSG